MKKTGKIVAVTPLGNAVIKGNTLQNYMVHFADGNEYQFLAKGNFKKNVGDEVSYEVTNEQYKNASLIYEQKTTSFSGKREISTNDSILLQVCYKANKDMFGADHNNEVKENTIEDFKWMKEFLTSL